MIKNQNFNLVKLLKLCEELNEAYDRESYYSVVALLRTIMNYVPPIFGKSNFLEITNNYANKHSSFEKAMKHLEGQAKHIADIHLHKQAHLSESLPLREQVDFKQSLDLLLQEICELLGRSK